MTKILFMGDMAGTGFGTVTMDLGRAMLDKGVDVRFVSLNEVADLPEPFASRTLSLGRLGGWLVAPETVDEASEVLHRLAALFTSETWPDRWAPDASIILGDFYAVRRLPPETIASTDIPLFHYCPVEGVGLPPRWAAFWQRVQPIAMSNFGAEQIELVMGHRPPMAYHGVDTSAFFPVSAATPIVLRGANDLHILKSKADCKRFFGADPNSLWLFRADRNMPRKRYASLFRSVAPVLAKHPNVSLVYHCLTDDQGGNLDDEKSKFHPAIAQRMISTGFHDRNGGIDRKVLNALYNAADIYVSTSAEGFGLTIAEALACGTPAVAMDYSSVTEVVGMAGSLVKPAFLVDNEYAHWWAGVDETAFSEAVEYLVTHKQKRIQLGKLGPIHVMRHFTWAKAADTFIEAVTEALPSEVAVG